MKLIQTDRDTLLKPLQAVAGVVERRHTLPILSNVLIEKKNDQLTLTATDLDIQVSTNSAYDQKHDDYAVTVSAKKLQDILRALPDSTVLNLEANNNLLQVKAGKSKFNLQTLPSEDFPRLAQGAALTTIELSQHELKNLLLLVQYAMAQQDIRYYLNGLLLLVEEDTLRVVATDGHRLALGSMKIAPQSQRYEVILPRKAVLELAKLLAPSDEVIRLEIGQTQVKFSFGNITLVTKLVDGKFPDFTRVIPNNYQKHFEVDRVQLQQALQRAAILSNEKFRGVRWVLNKNSLRIVCTNTEQEEAQEELEIEYNDDALDIGFNINYLLDVLNNVDSQNIDCGLGDPNSSMLITIPGNEDFKYVVMPMRI